MSKLKKFITKFILSCLIFVLLAVSIAPKTAYAQGSWYAPSYGEWQDKVFDRTNPQEIFGERYTYAQVLWIVYSLISVVSGTDLLECINSSPNAQDLEDCVEASSQGGTSANSVNIGSWADLLLSTRPASGITYVSSLAARFKLVPEAYAQGFGFRTLEPVLTVWKITRNITYLLLVVVILALAFMIMFRVKISPQVVITVQSALPKVAITLVLITFSYAIAGLILDLSYVIVGLVAIFIKSVGSQVTNLSVVELFNEMLVGHLGRIFLPLLLAALISIALGTAGFFFLPTGGPILGGIGIILGLLIIVFLVVTALRILWLLFRTFINIVLLVIAGPIMILLGALSPNAGGFGQWFRTLLSNVAVYPIVIIMVFLAHFFFWGFFLSGAFGDLLSPTWLNPYGINTGSLTSTSPIYLPGFEQPASHLFGFILAFGIVLLIPSVGNMIQAMIQGKPFAYGTALGEAIGMVPRGVYTGMDVATRASRIPEALSRVGVNIGRPRGKERMEPAVAQRLKQVATPIGPEQAMR